MDKQIELNSVQKAATILVAMGRERATRLLKYFKGQELRRLIDAAHSLETIPQTYLDELVEEFEREFAEGGGLLDSAEAIDSIISEAFTPEEFRQLLEPAAEIEEAVETEPFWPKMDTIETEEVSEFISQEHPLTRAVILSKLSSRKAADIVAMFDRDNRKQVLKHMMALGTPSGRASRVIENVLREQFADNGSDTAANEGRIRVANVLNELDKSNMEEVFDDLANDSDPDNMAAVKSMLFRFEDIVLLEQSARSVIFDSIEADAITAALRGAEEELSEAVLSALGQRTRRMIESELAAEGPADDEATAQARRDIASTAISLASEKRITLPSAQEEAA